MKKEKLKHMILITVAVCLIGIGYLNYDYDSTLEVAAMHNQTDENTIGDVAFVNSNAVKSDIVPNDETQVTATNSNSKDEEYFSATRLERETMYSQML